MIILWKYQRYSKMHKYKAKDKWYNTRTVYLFDPVFWLWRDHCRVENIKYKFKPDKRYILIGKKQKYDNKTSITPRFIL